MEINQGAAEGSAALCKGRGCYVWATEFENVHQTWARGFAEPGFEFGGRWFAGSEQLFQLQKAGVPGSPGFEEVW